MAIAKTPKTAPAKPAVAKAAAKPAAKAAAASKAPEETVVHSNEIAAQAVEANTQDVEAAVAEAAKPAQAIGAAAAEVAANPAQTVAAPLARLPKETEEKMLQGVETFLEFNRDNAILLVSTSNEFALGLQKLSQSLLDWSAESCDKSVAATSALLSAKTVEEVLDLSQEMARDSLQQILKESSEIGSLSTKLFETAFAPLAGRMVANVEKPASHTH